MMDKEKPVWSSDHGSVSLLLRYAPLQVSWVRMHRTLPSRKKLFNVKSGIRLKKL